MVLGVFRGKFIKLRITCIPDPLLIEVVNQSVTAFEGVIAANVPDWVVVYEHDGGKTYVDRASITRETSLIQALVRYATSPSGMDKRNGKPVKEMLALEEYDTASSCFRCHKIVFAYEDGTKSDVLLVELEWFPATDGYGKTLEFLRGERSH
jgi:hypothetical protein